MLHAKAWWNDWTLRTNSFKDLFENSSNIYFIMILKSFSNFYIHLFSFQVKGQKCNFSRGQTPNLRKELRKRTFFRSNEPRPTYARQTCVEDCAQTRARIQESLGIRGIRIRLFPLEKIFQSKKGLFSANIRFRVQNDGTYLQQITRETCMFVRVFVRVYMRVCLCKCTCLCEF
jgi:hypothetical protein